jgi:triosephosphate isomerase (TIM)
MKNLTIVANWKSNKDTKEALEWLKIFSSDLYIHSEVKVVISPQFPQIEPLKKEIDSNNYPLYLGIQDISPFSLGAFTGEVAAETLKGGVYLSIIGHSERRKYFGETEEIINQKVQQALESNIIPLVCVQGADSVVTPGCRMVAYEPIFAIGTDNPDTPENANRVASILKEKHGSDLKVLYGGSVDGLNYKEFIRQDNISGLLIGRASWDAISFKEIVNGCSS